MGLKKTCIKQEVTIVHALKNCSKKARNKGLKCVIVKKRSLRCADFKSASKAGKHPKCDSRLDKGGRSPGLVRKGLCAGKMKRK